MSMHLTHRPPAKAAPAVIAVANKREKSVLRMSDGGETVPPKDFNNE